MNSPPPRLTRASCREIIEVPEDSPDAAKWQRYEEGASSADVSEPMNVSMTDLTQLPDVTPSQPPPPHRRPGPRRGKVTLPGFTMGHKIVRTPTSPHAVDPAAHAANTPTRYKTSTPTALSTLDKSALDWHSHIQSHTVDQSQATPLRDELDAHRRGGGSYLEKVALMSASASATASAPAASASGTGNSSGATDASGVLASGWYPGWLAGQNASSDISWEKYNMMTFGFAYVAIHPCRSRF